MKNTSDATLYANYYKKNALKILKNSLNFFCFLYKKKKQNKEKIKTKIETYISNSINFFLHSKNLKLLNF